MRRMSLLAMVVSLTMLACGGSAETPQGFFDGCEADADCTGSWRCLESYSRGETGEAVMRCTTACSTDRDCPELDSECDTTYCSDQGVCGFIMCVESAS
jgi:hypothetical protein